MNWTPQQITNLVGMFVLLIFGLTVIVALFSDEFAKIIEALRGETSEDEE